MTEDVEDRLDRFEGAIGELRGRVGALETLVLRSPPAEDKHAGVKSAITFVSVVVIPILVALLGGYFALKAAGLR